MVQSKKFVAIWFAAIIIASALLIGWAKLLDGPIAATKVKGSHFSVVWKGFKPTYSDKYPDYYICINNLKDDLLRMYVQLKIENFENVSLYFKIENYTAPLDGWFVGPQELGFVPIENPTAYFTYSNLKRTKPAAIAEGSLHESVELAVKAYYDSGYTQFYSQDNFTINFHFIDVTSSAWTRLEYYNFDDGTLQGWSTYSLQSYTYYRSWPSSIYLYSYASKTIDMIGNYTEAYIVGAMYCSASAPTIYLGGTLSFRSETPSGSITWNQIACPLPLNQATSVMFYASGCYMDDIYVVAKS